MQLKYFNFRTLTYEERECPSDWSDYIPQDEIAQRVYQLHIELGKHPMVAAGLVMAAWLGIKFDEPTKEKVAG